VTPALLNRAHTTAFPGLAGTNMVFTGGDTIYSTYCQPRGGVRFDTGCSEEPTMFPLVSGKKYIVVHTPTAASKFTIIVNIFRVSIGSPKTFTALVYPSDVIVPPVLWNKLTDLAHLTNSEIGVDGTERGTAVFAPAKWTTGIHITDTINGTLFADPMSGIHEGTIQFWYRADAIVTSDITAAFDFDGVTRCFFYRGSGVDTCDFAWFYPGNITVYSSAFSLPADTSDHLFAVSWSESGSLVGSKTVAVYIDAVKVFDTADAISNTTNSNLVLGLLAATVYPFMGVIADLKIFDYIKNASDFTYDLTHE
jgi:hypothetical protein